VASIVGPFVGGAITDALSWRWVFYVSLPFGAHAAWLVGRRLEEPPTHPTAPIDVAGATLLGAAITTLLVALSQTGVSDAALSPPLLIALYAASLALGLLFTAVERRAADPIVPPDLLRDRFIGLATLTSVFIGVAIFGAISFVPLFVQAALGGSALDAGRSLMPLLLGWVVTAAVAGRVLPRVGYRPMVICGTTLLVAGFAGLTLVTHRSTSTLLPASLVLVGVGTGMAALALFIGTQNAVARDRLGVATSLTPFARSVGGAVGVAVMGSLLAASLPVARAATALEMEAGLHRAFVAGAAVSAMTLVLALFVPPVPIQDRRAVVADMSDVA
jgi:MFS family permease